MEGPLLKDLRSQRNTRVSGPVVVYCGSLSCHNSHSSSMASSVWCVRFPLRVIFLFPVLDRFHFHWDLY